MGAYGVQITTITMDDNPQIWTASEIDSIERSLSPERFARYLSASSTKPEALEYYRWNTALSGAFYGPLQCLEVGLRNAVHERLAPRYGATWYQNQTIMRGPGLAMASEAIDRITVLRKPVSPGRVVAELSFGFWVGLFSNAYDATLWRQDLHRLFSPRPHRSDLHDKLDRLRTLRNRIAHHEPIFQRNLVDDFNRIQDVLRSVAPELRDWMTYHNRVLDILSDGPNGGQRF